MVELLAYSDEKRFSAAVLTLFNDKQATQKVNIAFSSSKTKKHFFYSSCFPSQIELTITGNDFSIEKILIIKINHYFAFSKIIKKLKNVNPGFSGKSRTKILKSIYNISKKEKLGLSQSLYQEYFLATEFQLLSNEEKYHRWIKKNETPPSTEALIKPVVSYLSNSQQSTSLYRANAITYSVIKTKALSIDTLNNIRSSNYLILLAPDAEISSDALNIISSVIGNQSNLTLIYADEDRIDDLNNRSSPNFKPDFNLDLLYCSNYIGNNFIVSIEKLIEIMIKKAKKISNNHELLLEIVKESNSEKIVHIPNILFHNNKTTVAHNITEINYNPIVYPKGNLHQKISIIIPTRDKVALLIRNIESILEKTTYNNFEIIIVNNQSKEKETFDYFSSITKSKNISIINYDKPFNYSAMNNYAVNRATGEILLLLNNDTEVISPNWLTELLRHACHPDVGCVGARLIYADWTVQHGGIILGINGVAGHAHRGIRYDSDGYCNRLKHAQNFSAVTAACLMVTKEIYLKVGGFNENLPISMNDVDFCLRVRRLGYRNIWTPHALLFHHESQSRGTEVNHKIRKQTQKEVSYIKDKWAELVCYDPAYNPNLTRLSEDFSISPFSYQMPNAKQNTFLP